MASISFENIANNLKEIGFDKALYSFDGSDNSVSFKIIKNGEKLELSFDYTNLTETVLFSSILTEWIKKSFKNEENDETCKDEKKTKIVDNDDIYYQLAYKNGKLDAYIEMNDKLMKELDRRFY